MRKVLFVLGPESLLKTGATGGLELSLFELYRRCSPYVDVDVAVRQVRDAGELPIRWDLSSRYPSPQLLEVDDYISRVVAAADGYDAVVGFDAVSLCQVAERPIANIFVSHLGEWFPGGPMKGCEKHLYAFPGRWMIERFRLDHPEVFDERRCRHLPMGVDLAKFSPRRTATHGFTLGFAGQWTPLKGVLDFLEAVRLLRDEISELRVSCAGAVDLWDFGDRQEGIRLAELRREIETRFAELEGDHLGLLAHDAMPAFWSDVDVAVVPSIWDEAGPIVAMEALACGTPIVGSDVAGVNEIVRPGVNGELFKPGDSQDLAAKCRKLYHDQERLERYRWNARRTVLGYSWDHAAQVLLAILRDLSVD